MKKIYFVLAFTLLHLSSIAQLPYLNWAMKFGNDSTYNTNLDYKGKQVQVDLDGNVYSLGEFRNNINFGDGNYYSPCNLGRAIYILKQSSDGNILWKKFICSYNTNVSFDFKIDKQNNINLIIHNSPNVTLDSSITNSNSITLSSGIHIVRLNNQGNLIWHKDFYVTNLSYTGINSIVFDKNNNLYALGEFNSTIDFDPGIDSFKVSPTGMNGFLLKLDPNGDFKWVKTIHGHSGTSFIENCVIDNNDNLFFNGAFTDTADIDLGPNVQILLKNNPQQQLAYFLEKADTNGNLIWYKDSSYASGIFTVDNNNNLIVYGGFIDSISFTNSTSQKTLSAPFNYYFAKYNEQGEYTWANAMSGMNIKNIKTDNLSSIYSSGNFTDTINFHPNDTINNIIASNSIKLFLFKLDSMGNYVFDFIVNSKYYSDDKISLDLDNNMNIYLTGTIRDTTDFDPSASINNVNCKSNTSGIFITKYSTYPLNINSTISKSNIANLYPNPTSGIFNLEMNENANLMISNSLGEIILKQKVSKGLSTINISNKPVGIYFVRLQTDQYSETIKIVKE